MGLDTPDSFVLGQGDFAKEEPDVSSKTNAHSDVLFTFFHFPGKAGEYPKPGGWLLNASRQHYRDCMPAFSLPVAGRSPPRFFEGKKIFAKVMGCAHFTSYVQLELARIISPGCRFPDDTFSPEGDRISYQPTC